MHHCKLLLNVDELLLSVNSHQTCLLQRFLLLLLQKFQKNLTIFDKMPIKAAISSHTRLYHHHILKGTVPSVSVSRRHFKQSKNPNNAMNGWPLPRYRSEFRCRHQSCDYQWSQDMCTFAVDFIPCPRCLRLTVAHKIVSLPVSINKIS